MDKTSDESRINEMTETVMNVARGNYSAQIELTGKNDDLDSLAIGINIMIEDIQANVNQIKEKIEELENTELATLNILEDFQETILNLEKAEKEIGNKNKELAATQKELKKLNVELEQRVIERTEEMEKLLKQKDEFVNQLGHDLKTPVTPLVTLLPIVKKRQTDQKSKELLDVSIQNVKYMKNLIIKTIQLARLNAPSTQLEIVDTNLLEELNKIIDNNQLIFKENKIKVENKIKDDIIVKVDKLRLDELFNNLITNAIKYTSKGGLLTFDAQKDRDFVIISLTDNGIGLSKEQIDHVFDEFYKVDSSRHDLDSSGLGLSICKRIVEKHGGRIWVDSPGIGKGSTFYFTLIKSESKKIMEVN